eukprot:3938867-Prymnesium_polylepis.1
MNPLRRVPQFQLLHPEPHAVREGTPGVGVAEERERQRVVGQRLARSGPLVSGGCDVLPAQRAG